MGLRSNWPAGQHRPVLHLRPLRAPSIDRGSRKKWKRMKYFVLFHSCRTPYWFILSKESRQEKANEINSIVFISISRVMDYFEVLVIFSSDLLLSTEGLFWNVCNAFLLFIIWNVELLIQNEKRTLKRHYYNVFEHLFSNKAWDHWLDVLLVITWYTKHCANASEALIPTPEYVSGIHCINDQGHHYHVKGTSNN